ncbi:hypothetical protein QFC22_005316 [Naganishia vaughanmartiniae]|uniref:Uncharacterized protein n=1 Tax=Naganishia vaughanmartiniae TaxID=1424756 RepID=A0ACC2WU12_9TREE|nr:hypothetical protein QFC22_005316 [Naganishia vaughanmartiniae]
MSENNAGAIDPATGTTLSHHNPAGNTEFEHGKEGAHNRIDSKDERSIANNLKDAERVEKLEKQAEEEAAHTRPTDAARSHGNEPSRGAKIDEQLELEEEAELRRKGKM